MAFTIPNLRLIFLVVVSSDVGRTPVGEYATRQVVDAE